MSRKKNMSMQKSTTAQLKLHPWRNASRYGRDMAMNETGKWHVQNGNAHAWDEGAQNECLSKEGGKGTQYCAGRLVELS